MKTTIWTILLLVVATCALANCRTTRGLGQDMQHLGAKIEQEAAEKTRY